MLGTARRMAEVLSKTLSPMPRGRLQFCRDTVEVSKRLMMNRGDAGGWCWLFCSSMSIANGVERKRRSRRSVGCQVGAKTANEWLEPRC